MTEQKMPLGLLIIAIGLLIVGTIGFVAGLILSRMAVYWNKYRYYYMWIWLILL